MKYLKYFEKADQLWKADQARDILSQVYTIVDEVPLSGEFSDFLVDYQDFFNIVDKYGDDYCFATNGIDTKISDIKYYIEYELDFSPRIMIAPYWVSRSPSDILSFKKYTIYSDTLYLLIDSDELSSEEVETIGRKYNADEYNLCKSKNGEIYLRLWWD